MSKRVLGRCRRVLRQLINGRITGLALSIVLGGPCAYFLAPCCGFGLVGSSPSSGGFMSYTIVTGTGFVIARSQRFSMLGRYPFPGVRIVKLSLFLRSLWVRVEVGVLMANTGNFVNQGLMSRLRGVRSKGTHGCPISKARLGIFRCSASDSPTRLSICYGGTSFIFGLTKIGHPGSRSRFVGKGFNFTSLLLSALGGRNGAYPIVVSSSARTTLSGPCNRSGQTKRGLLFRCTRRANTEILICHFPGIFKG